MLATGSDITDSLQNSALPDNNIVLGQCRFIKIYNVSAFNLQDFEQLQRLALKLRHINQHYDPASASEPIVAIENGAAPLFLDPPAGMDSTLTDYDKQLMESMQCGLYAEGIDEADEPYYAYFHIKANLLEKFLKQQAEGPVNLKEYFCYPLAHGEGLPSDDTKLEMAQKCFIRGVLQIFGFREKAVQW